MHHEAYLPPTTTLRISKGAKCVVESGVSARDRVVLNVSSAGTLRIGKNVFINDSCCINCRDSIVIGNNTMMGQGVMLYDHDHDYRAGILAKRESFVTSPIVIGKNVWIGSGVLILKGARIGDNSIIGAGCTIHRDVPPNSLVFVKQEQVIRDISTYCEEVVDC